MAEDTIGALLPTDADDHADKSALALDKETATKLVEIQDNLNEVLSLYYFHCFACQELAADMPLLHDDKFLFGMSLTRQWLEKRGKKLMRKVERVRESISKGR